jgi:hypothetical protein
MPSPLHAGQKVTLCAMVLWSGAWRPWPSTCPVTSEDSMDSLGLKGVTQVT